MITKTEILTNEIVKEGINSEYDGDDIIIEFNKIWNSNFVIMKIMDKKYKVDTKMMLKALAGFIED